MLFGICYKNCNSFRFRGSANVTTSSGASLVGLNDDTMTYITGDTNVQNAIKEIDTAEATARLYGNTLNALAHRNAGLDAAAAIAGSIPAWHLEVADLDRSCELLEALDF